MIHSVNYLVINGIYMEHETSTLPQSESQITSFKKLLKMSFEFLHVLRQIECESTL